MTILGVARKGTVLTEEQVIELLRKAQKDRSLRDFATELGVSPSYISDIYRGSRDPGEKILSQFGIRKTRRVIVEYQLEKK